MKKFKSFMAVFFLLANMGCEKPTALVVEPPPPVPDTPLPVVNTAPKVAAGANINVFLPADSAFLYGSVTDAEYNIDSSSWRQISGPGQAIILSPDLVHTKISKLIKGEYSFELTVIDKAGLRGKDTANIAVIDTSGTGIIRLKAIEVGCWGPECWASFDTSTTKIYRNVPIKVFLKSLDAALWTEIPQTNYFFSTDGKYFWIEWYGLDDRKVWELMIVY